MKRNSMPYIVVDSLGEIIGEYANMAEAIADAKRWWKRSTAGTTCTRSLQTFSPVGKAEVITYE